MAEVTTSADRSKLSLSKKNKLTIGKTKVNTPTKLTGATEEVILYVVVTQAVEGIGRRFLPQQSLKAVKAVKELKK